MAPRIGIRFGDRQLDGAAEPVPVYSKRFGTARLDGVGAHVHVDCILRGLRMECRFEEHVSEGLSRQFRGRGVGRPHSPQVSGETGVTGRSASRVWRRERVDLR